MPQQTYQEREKAILAEEKALIERARNERDSSIQNAKQIEQELSRRSLEAIDKLRQRLKEAGSAQEKAELKEAVKEAETAAKQAIARAKQNSQRLITSARQKEKEEIKKAEEARKAAIKSLKEKNASSKAISLEEYSDNSAENSDTLGTLQVKPEPERDTAEVQGNQAGRPSETVLEQEKSEPAESGDLKYSGYDSIRKALEETAKKLEATRSSESSDETSTLAIAEESVRSGQNQPGSSQAIIQPDRKNQTTVGKPQKKNDKGEKADVGVVEEPFVLTREKLDTTFNGQVQIFIENPSSAGSMRSLGEKLKQVKGLRIMLFGGSADEGVQIVVNATEPVKLAPKIQEISEMEIVNVNKDEIRLRVLKNKD